ncbi:NAD-dependent epimerase/dehydratase family protein [Blastococcus tunisiensis]|uniref:dTDP-L-rhamnose 4-epimerase n=1 Tax=Blastococcus tunisiensis TaxID=1798228 RepID=A0A1I2JD44_9ACTN|nr:NAD-dependent epimerase/dehydratase family protein [Blastococcus sp. DSM 46838]SFF51087.1 dTDP-L-rhamnose 4-epimerase [Blastococcus sp. DSM 46838]
MAPQTVLITGGAGFIGSRLASRLVGEGHEVVIADVLHPQVHDGRGWPADTPEAAVRYPVDVTSASQCDALLRLCTPDVVVHLAAETGTGQSLTQASRHGRVNVVGTTELLDALARAGHVPEHVVLASSRAVYGEGRWSASDGSTYYAAPRSAAQLEAGQWDPQPPTAGLRAVAPLPHAAATTEPRPTNVYAATKLAQEHILGAWTVAMGSRFSVLRLQNVYGPGQSLSNPYTGIMSLFARKALAHEQIDVYEGGQIIRDLVFVDDVVAALQSCLGRSGSEPLLADIGSGRAVSLQEMAEFLAHETGAPEPLTSGHFRAGDVRAASADISHAATTLGYRPAVEPKAGLRRLLEWIAGDAPGDQGL